MHLHGVVEAALSDGCWWPPRGQEAGDGPTAIGAAREGKEGHARAFIFLSHCTSSFPMAMLTASPGQMCRCETCSWLWQKVLVSAPAPSWACLGFGLKDELASLATVC